MSRDAEPAEQGEPRRDDEADPSMFEDLKEAAYGAEYDTGRRESTRAQARASIYRRLARMALGFTLLFAGALMLVLPGPGWLSIAAGLGILSRDVAWAERALQRVRRKLPQDSDGKVSKAVIVTSIVIALAGVAFSLWLWLT